MRRLILSPILLAALAGPIAAQAADMAKEQARVEVRQSETYGAYLTDSEGRTLYLFTADTKGRGGEKAKTDCYDDCAAAWPPLLTRQAPAAGDKADRSLLGTITRKDGAKQVTYNGWPLYYFVQDRSAGAIQGQDKHGFGGEWYLLSPAGKKVEKE